MTSIHRYLNDEGLLFSKKQWHQWCANYGSPSPPPKKKTNDTTLGWTELVQLKFLLRNFQVCILSVVRVLCVLSWILYKRILLIIDQKIFKIKYQVGFIFVWYFKFYYFLKLKRRINCHFEYQNLCEFNLQCRKSQLVQFIIIASKN